MSVVTDQGPGATGIQCVVARMLLSAQNASAELSTSRQWSCRRPHPDTRWARSSPCPRRRPADRTPGPPSADVVSQARVLVPLKQDYDCFTPPRLALEPSPPAR